jgi:hypothetical protein
MRTCVVGVQAGAIFVNTTAKAYFKELFASAKLEPDDIEDYAEEAVDSFEAEGKKTFEGPRQDNVSIKVGDHRFTQRAIGIRRGILTLGGFVPSITFYVLLPCV